MCIYCGTTRYRKIYENHYGAIPTDETGRTFEIHHIDGNHHNNHPSNLKAVSIGEHLKIHQSQGDWGACWAIASRMENNPQEISDWARAAAKKSAIERVNAGTHNWQNKEWARSREQEKVLSGTHPFLGGHVARANALKRLDSGTHNFQGPRSPSKQRAANGRLSAESKAKAARLIAEGVHNFIGDSNPNNDKISCRWCGKEVGRPMHGRYHGDKCLQSPARIPRTPVSRKQCEHCEKTFLPNAYSRYHGPKCKAIKTFICQSS